MHQMPGEGEGMSPPTVAAAIEPSPELLDRALVGWEQFLNTFGGPTDE